MREGKNNWGGMGKIDKSEGTKAKSQYCNISYFF